MIKANKTGTITPALLVITGAFVTVIYGLLMLVALQFDYSNRQLSNERALAIAEAGINYYRWRLAHDPDDFSGGTFSYGDPESGEVGTYEIEVIPPEDGSSIVTIRSTGSTSSHPNMKRTVSVQYGRRSFARFAFASNASTWYGSGIVVHGDVHSNNGIRMDGTNYGLVTSARETYMCGTETGCFPPTQRPGVWGAGGDQALWSFPVPVMDFDSISFDFSQMKTAAQNDGLYLAPSNSSGYHLVFNANGTVDVYRVTQLGRVRGYRVPGEGLGQEGEGGCRWRYQIIENEVLVGNYSVEENPIIFAEDHVWVEGVVNGEVTVAAAGFPVSARNMNIWIRNNITYANGPMTDALGLIAQNDVVFVRDVPEDFEINAALLAQKGQVLRHGYYCSGEDNSNAIRDSLTINGALISYSKSYWNYGNPLESGFVDRTINYNSNFLFNPPPFFPTSGSLEFINWKEE